MRFDSESQICNGFKIRLRIFFKSNPNDQVDALTVISCPECGDEDLKLAQFINN